MTTHDLYDNLIELVASNEAFYFKDFEYKGVIYRIFSYRLASYTDFLQPSALECRGVMFEVDMYGHAMRLVSRTPEKFFNLHEVPHDVNTLAEALVKQGRLSEDVYKQAKKRYNQTLT